MIHKKQSLTALTLIITFYAFFAITSANTQPRYKLMGQIIIDTITSNIIPLPENSTLTIEEYYNQLISQEQPTLSNPDNSTASDADNTNNTSNEETPQTDDNTDTTVQQKEETPSEEKTEETTNTPDTSETTPETEETEEIQREESDTNNKTKQPLTQEEILTEAIAWMYDNGMTRFADKEKYNPQNTLTREQSAKILVQAYDALWYEKKDFDTDCSFRDIDQADETLKDFIVQSCEKGIYKGVNGDFFPTQDLTLGQLVALIIRMQQWGKLDETRDPRYATYIDTAKEIGILEAASYEWFDSPALRQDIALLLYALKALQETTATQPQLDLGGGIVTEGLSSEQNPILQSAVLWMWINNMTRFGDVTSYRPFDTLSKQAASKIMGQFHKTFVGGGVVNDSCQFDDIDEADQTLVQDIIYVCERGIFKWWANIFSPNKTLTKAEFVIGLLRIFGEDEWITQNTNPRWQWYFDKAVELWIVSQSEFTSFDSPLTRYEVATMLYNFHIRHIVLQQSNQPSPELMTYVMDDIVMIDTSRLVDNDFDKWRITLDGITYQIMKTSNDNVFGQNSVRYGHIYDLTDKEVSWVINLIISQGRIIQWTIRPSFESETYFDLSLSTEYSWLYILEKHN